VTREDIINQLENYKDNKAFVEIRKLELENYKTLSEEEAIESLILNSLQGDEKVQCNNISDKTKNIALNYDKITENYNISVVQEILKEIKEVNFSLNKLETAVNGLAEKEEIVIKEIYFNKKTINSVLDEMEISRRTLERYRNNGIGKLCEIYKRLEKYQ